MPTDTKAACAGDCGNASPDHALCDKMGVGKDAHYICDVCKYNRRAGGCWLVRRSTWRRSASRGRTEGARPTLCASRPSALAGALEHMETERIKRENGERDETNTPRKPAKRARTDDAKIGDRNVAFFG